MKYRKRIYYTEADKALMWDRWQEGDSFHEIAGLLRQRWSPWQIAGRLKRLYPHDEDRRVSHETIYKTLFILARGARSLGR